MPEQAAATFAVKSWDEKPYNEMPRVPKLTRAIVTKSYQGDIVGEGKLDYLMMYRDDESLTQPTVMDMPTTNDEVKICAAIWLEVLCLHGDAPFC